MTIDITGAPVVGELKQGEWRDAPIAPHLIGHLQKLPPSLDKHSHIRSLR